MPEKPSCTSVRKVELAGCVSPWLEPRKHHQACRGCRVGQRPCPRPLGGNARLHSPRLPFVLPCPSLASAFWFSSSCCFPSVHRVKPDALTGAWLLLLSSLISYTCTHTFRKQECFLRLTELEPLDISPHLPLAQQLFIFQVPLWLPEAFLDASSLDRVLPCKLPSCFYKSLLRVSHSLLRLPPT